MDQKRTRREALCILGAAGATMLVGCGGSTVSGSRAGGSGGGAGGSPEGGPNPGAGGTASSGTGGAGGASNGGASSGGVSNGGVSGGGASSGGASSGGAASGAGGTSVGAAGGGACEPKQETTVGPYPNVDPLSRADVRGNTSGTTTAKEGAQLTLRIRVQDLQAFCAPVPGAVVDIWHCDATGVYAGYAPFGTTGQDFCRGYQTTDAQGVVEFVTIFPGSYAGRAIHIHFSIQGTETNLRPNDEGANLPGVFVAQLYFARAAADEIFGAVPLYQQGAPITPNESDGIFAAGGGAALVVSVTKSGSGYVGEVVVGVARGSIGK